MPVLAAPGVGINAFLAAGQGSGYSKRCCCCCNPLSCPCDMKRGKADPSGDVSLAFSARAGVHIPEDAGSVVECIKQNNPSEITQFAHGVFARAPCTAIYLATLNLLC